MNSYKVISLTAGILLVSGWCQAGHRSQAQQGHTRSNSEAREITNQIVKDLGLTKMPNVHKVLFFLCEKRDMSPQKT